MSSKQNGRRFEKQLQSLTWEPAAFSVVHGCVLVDDGWTPHARTVAKHLQRCDGDKERVEYLVNRRFVVAHLLDERMEKPLSVVSDMTPEVCDAIGRIAVTYAEMLREALQQAFPAQTFNVEVIGTNYAEEEPLEVCVTFFRAR